MNLPETIVFEVMACASCAEPHKLEWRRFTYFSALQVGLLFWTLCPKTGEPTFLMKQGDPPGSEYGLWSVNDGAWLGTNGELFHTTSRDMAEAQMAMMRGGHIIRVWEIRRFGAASPIVDAGVLSEGGERPS